MSVFVAILVGIAIGFGLSTYGSTKLIAAAAQLMSAKDETIARLTAQARYLAGHVKHKDRMLRFLRARPIDAKAVRLLGLKKETAKRDDVQREFRALARAAHPDRGGDPAVFRLVTAVRDEALREVDAT